MGLLRSETMKHGTLVLPPDRAREFMDLLGRKTNIQIVDMNSTSMKRDYNRYVQRIEEVERILRFLEEEIYRLPHGDSLIQTGKMEEFLTYDDTYTLDKVESALSDLHAQFTKFRDNNHELVKQRNVVLEERCVVYAASTSLSPEYGFAQNSDREVGQSLLGHESARRFEDPETGAGAMQFSNIAGVLPLATLEQFSRTLFRVTRGNAFTHSESIDRPFIDEKTGKEVIKCVVVVHYQGAKGSFLHSRITKICEAFQFRTYRWPKTHQEAVQRLYESDNMLKEKDQALVAYDDFILTEIGMLLETPKAGGNSLIEDWRLFGIKEKAIYATLNMFETSDATLRADCWFPAEDEEDIRRLLYDRSDVNRPSAFLLTDVHTTRKAPPTYNRVTKFTEAFQGMVDTYGVPRYKEVNPALLTMITFPFLFGVMYGDIGHGGCLSLFASWFLYKADQLKSSKNELVQMLMGGRYIIFLMAWFAFYAGWLYNDFFSLGLNLFGTRYKFGTDGPRYGQMTYVPDESKTFPYPFGFDPIWKGTTNEIIFYNSFKMKFAVIVGLIQMTAGVFNKGLNAIYFRSALDFFFEFVPQLLFLFCLVGYMDFLIIWKWVTPYSEAKAQTSIVNLLIKMCMGGRVAEDMLLYPSQNAVQTTLFITMGICIPLMLFPKPIILIRRNNAAVAQKELELKCEKGSDEKSRSEGVEREATGVPRESSLGGTDMESGGLLSDRRVSHAHEHSVEVPHEDDEEEEFDAGEVFIHQMIESIEFVLGCVSNTASYLRLWALSLAHQQLALVFFNNTILAALGMGSVVGMTIMLLITFIVFAATTFAVLLCMDTLECFLHALRLQWVEYQNKFFKADGYAFAPFSFGRILSGKDDE